MPEDKPVRVLISYSHDSDAHRDAVLKLAFRLREAGIDSWLDRFAPHSAGGWPLRMERQIAAADFVLVVCTETYRRRFDGKEDDGKGLGVAWEAELVRDVLYAKKRRNPRLIRVLLEGASRDHVPTTLSGNASLHPPA